MKHLKQKKKYHNYSLITYENLNLMEDFIIRHIVMMSVSLVIGLFYIIIKSTLITLVGYYSKWIKMYLKNLKNVIY